LLVSLLDGTGAKQCCTYAPYHSTGTQIPVAMVCMGTYQGLHARLYEANFWWCIAGALSHKCELKTLSKRHSTRESTCVGLYICCVFEHELIRSHDSHLELICDVLHMLVLRGAGWASNAPQPERGKEAQEQSVESCV